MGIGEALLSLGGGDVVAGEELVLIVLVPLELGRRTPTSGSRHRSGLLTEGAGGPV